MSVTGDIANMSLVVTFVFQMVSTILGLFLTPPVLYFTVLGLIGTAIAFAKGLMGKKKK